MADEVKRAKLKQAAYLRSLFNYNVALKRIDFNADVIQPALERVERDAAKGELPVFEQLSLNENTTTKKKKS